MKDSSLLEYWEVLLSGSENEIISLYDKLESLPRCCENFEFIYLYAKNRVRFLEENYAESVVILNSLIESFGKDNPELEAFCLLRKIRDLFAVNNFAEAHVLLDTLYVKLNSIESGKLKALCFNDLGVIGYSNSDSSIDWEYCLLYSMELSNDIGDIGSLVNTCINLTAFYSQKGELVKALNKVSFCNNLLSHCSNDLVVETYVYTPWAVVKKETTLHKQQTALCINHAALLVDMGEYERALSELEFAFAMSKEFSLTDYQPFLLGQLGYIHTKLRENNKARKVYEEAISLKEQNGKKDLVYYSLMSSYATLELKVGSVANAELSFPQVHEFLERNNFPLQRAILLKNWAKLYIKKEEPQRAIQLLLEGLELSQTLGQQKLTCKYFRMLGMVYSSIHTETSYDYLMKALILSDEIKYKDELLVIHKELSTYYKLMGDTAQALLHFERHVQIKDELFNEQTNTKLRNLEILHEVEQYKSKLELTTSKVQLLETQLQSKTNEIQVMLLAMLQRQELLQKLERGLLQVLKTQKRKQEEAIQDFLKLLQKESNSQSSMNEIHQKFKEINQHFVNLLNNIAPNLTPLEIRLCILSRLSFSTKEIATLFNVSERTVENNRSRVRKKLKLQSTDNLVSYLIALENQMHAKHSLSSSNQLR